MERERGGTEQMRPRNVLSCVAGQPPYVALSGSVDPTICAGKAEPMLVPRTNCGELRREYPQEPAKWVSCSSIYRWLKKGLLEQSAALQVHLRHYKHQHGEKRGRFHGIRELNERSRQALWRKRVGDWEVDTIVSSNRKGCLLSVCDRKSRYCGLVLLRNCSAKEAMRGFRFLFEDRKLPLRP